MTWPNADRSTTASCAPGGPCDWPRRTPLEWGTPVLYLRAADGRIFDTTISVPQQPASSAEPVPTPEVAPIPGTLARQELSDPPAPPPADPRVVLHPKFVQTLQHRKRVNAVVFSPDGRLLILPAPTRLRRSGMPV